MPCGSPLARCADAGPAVERDRAQWTLDYPLVELEGRIHARRLEREKAIGREREREKS